MKLRSVAFILGSSCFFVIAGCGGGSTTGSGGTTGTTGGTTGSGGNTATGGAIGSGGATSTGGTTNTGGATATGGTTATGGAIGSGGATSTGGTTNTGGATATGGAAATGGATATGGRGGGTTATGGAGGTTATGGRGGTTGTGGAGGSTGTAHAMMNLFVTSDTRTNANFGGLAASDTRCQTLAAAAGHGAKTWRAYLSVATPATNAIDRIGPGPYYNAQGTMIAADKAALHARAGDRLVFLTEKGAMINGQWIGSPTPNEHDILTGTMRNGNLATGQTCGDWMSTTGAGMAGHSDGLGPNQSTSGDTPNWNAAHASSGNCGTTANGGGAGRIYCFVGP